MPLNNIAIHGGRVARVQPLRHVSVQSDVMQLLNVNVNRDDLKTVVS